MSTPTTQHKVAAYIENAERVTAAQAAEIAQLKTKVAALEGTLGAYDQKGKLGVDAVQKMGRIQTHQRDELTKKLAGNPVNVLHLLTTISDVTPTQVMAPIGRPTGAAKQAAAKQASSSRRQEVDQEHLASLNLPTHLAADLRRG